MSPIPVKIRSQRKRLKIVAVMAFFFALALFAVFCGLVTADWLG